MSAASLNRIPVAVAGLGRSGWGIHIKALASLPEQFDIVAVSDPSEERRQQAVQMHGCKAYETFDGLLEDKTPSLLVVATPNHLHVPHARAALEAGFDVVCEKPLALTSEQANELIAVSEQQERCLAPFQNLRFAPDFEKICEIIDSGKMGRVVQIRLCMHSFQRRWDFQTLTDFGGGELNGTGPHLIDQALMFFGDQQPVVNCHLDRALTSGDADDHFSLSLRVPNAPLVQVEVSRSCAFAQPSWLVMGTAGGIEGGISGLRWKWVDWSVMPERPVNREAPPDRDYNRESLDWQEDQWSGAEQGWVHTTRRRFYEQLYRSLREDLPLVVTPQQVRRQIAVIEQAHQEAQKHGYKSGGDV